MRDDICLFRKMPSFLEEMAFERRTVRDVMNYYVNTDAGKFGGSRPCWECPVECEHSALWPGEPLGV